MAQIDYIEARNEEDLKEQVNFVLNENRHLEIITIHPVGIGYVAWIIDKLK